MRFLIIEDYTFNGLVELHFWVDTAQKAEECIGADWGRGDIGVAILLPGGGMVQCWSVERFRKELQTLQ